MPLSDEKITGAESRTRGLVAWPYGSFMPGRDRPPPRSQRLRQTGTGARWQLWGLDATEKWQTQARTMENDKSTPYFTIIIPTYNRPQYLAHAIDSMLRQSFRDWQLIVVDDAGSIPAQVPDDDRIVLLRNEVNRGASASFNRGIDAAKGHVIGFLADDDAFASTRLSSAFTAHDAAGADLVLCRTVPLVPTPESGTPITSIAPAATREPVTSQLVECGPHVGPMAAITIVAELCPRLDESFPATEDIEWMVRVCQNRPRVMMISDEGFLWRKHEGERHDNGIEARILGYHMLFSKHSSYYADHRAEMAFRLRGLGLLNYKVGARSEAFRCALRSLVASPTVGAIELMIRTFLPRSWSWSALVSSEMRARILRLFP